MNVTIAGITFDQRDYDERGDVLYLSAGEPQAAARTIATPEGHAVDYDESAAVTGMVLVNVRFWLERDGAVTVTIPPDRVVAAQLAPALVACMSHSLDRFLSGLKLRSGEAAGQLSG